MRIFRRSHASSPTISDLSNVERSFEDENSDSPKTKKQKTADPSNFNVEKNGNWMRRKKRTDDDTPPIKTIVPRFVNMNRINEATKQQKDVHMNDDASSIVCDPVPDFSVFATNNMAEEMETMRKVFMKMAEKRSKQLKEKKEECKRMYIEAFAKDVEKNIITTQNERKKVMKKLDSDIEQTTEELHASISSLSESLQEYSLETDNKIDEIENELKNFQSLLPEIDQAYNDALGKVDEEYEKMAKYMEKYLDEMKEKLSACENDGWYMKVFQVEAARLLAEREEDTERPEDME